MKLVLLVTAAALALSGCASREAIQAREAAQQASLDAHDDGRCRQYGAQPGTRAYTECRMLIATQRSNAEAMSDAQSRAAGLELMGIGTQMMTGR